MPLPPYILKNWKTVTVTQQSMPENGSAAANSWSPFHTWIASKDWSQRRKWSITLHVGLGTFRPFLLLKCRRAWDALRVLPSVKTLPMPLIASKPLEAHHCSKTTSIRTLETIGNKYDGQLQTDSERTNIFIKPGYQFTVVDAFSTNFHLPESTLVMWTAFAGREFVLVPTTPSKNATASSALRMLCSSSESLMNKIERRHRLSTHFWRRRIHTNKLRSLRNQLVFSLPVTLSRDVSLESSKLTRIVPTMPHELHPLLPVGKSACGYYGKMP